MVRQSRGRYVVEFQQGGARIYKRLPQGCTKAQAQEWETKRRRELFDRGPLGKREDLTLQGAIGLWLQNNHRKNQKQAVSEAKQWDEFLRDRPLLKDAPEVAQRAVREWTATAGGLRSVARAVQMNTAKESPKATAPSAASTINRRLCIIKAAAKLAWKQGLIQDNISGRITLLPERNAREVYLTLAQTRRLSAAATKDVGCAIMIAAYTGLRASELLALTSSDARRHSLTVAQSKTCKPRLVPVPLPARAYLRALPLELSYWQLHKQFIAARNKAGMPHVQFHDLRHTAASWLANAGVDQFVVGRILGHISPQSTARYSHLFDKTLRKAMARLK